MKNGGVPLTVAAGIRADTGLGFRNGSRACEQAVASCATLVDHAEASTIAGDSNNDFISGDASLGKHDKGVRGLGDIDVGSQAVSILAARVGIFVSVIYRAEIIVSDVVPKQEWRRNGGW